ncbi:MAG: ATP-binding protein [Coriobacteriales bacterium]|jgi:AAA+ ATPase superfamily predicted ATPase
MFYCREDELKTLHEQFSSDERTFVLVYGKRRIGKSALIAKAAEDFDGTVINHLCVQSTFQGNLSLLCRSVSQALGLPAFTVSTLPDLFDFLEAQDRRILLVLDEYQYFKSSLRKGELDSYLQAIVDRLSSRVKLVLCGSYIAVMRELLDEDNPLFGRFTSIIHLREMDYLDAQSFYPHLSIHEKIARYAVFGGSPYVLSLLDQEHSLEEEVLNLLLPANSLLRTHIESVMLAEIRKSFDVRILQVLGNGRERYSKIASALGGDGSGLLGKQLKSLLEMETIEKTAPINRATDKKKTFYSIRDNLMRFYFCYLFANGALVERVGAKAFFQNVIAQSLRTFIALRFEDMVRQYFSRRAKAGELPGIEDIGTYWYDDKKRHVNGQFDCVLKRNGTYEFFEAKYYKRPMRRAECEAEEKQVRGIAGLDVGHIGFVCSAGFDFDTDDYSLISGEKLYDL